MKIASINIYGQTGMKPAKLLELEYFIEFHRLDVVCLQETDVNENTFSECNLISSGFYIIENNSRSGFGTCIFRQINFDQSVRASTVLAVELVAAVGLTVAGAGRISGSGSLSLPPPYEATMADCERV